MAIAGRLRRAAGESLVARVGRGQFAVLVERLETTEAATAEAERLRAAIEQPLTVNGEAVSLGVRVGISLSATTATLAEHLMHRAEMAVARVEPTVAEPMAAGPPAAEPTPAPEPEAPSPIRISTAPGPDSTPGAGSEVILRRKRRTSGLFTRIGRSWRSMTGLLRNAIEFAKLDAGEVSLHCVDVAVDPLLQELRHEVVPQTYAKSIRYHTSSCANDVWVRADPKKLRRVLHHLVANAIKFTEAGGEIRVECEANQQAVSIRVRDTGRGIPATWLTQVFEPYVQVDAHLMPRGQRGLGLGLAISQRLATGMGGALDAESEMGKGSAFTLTLLRA
jgi:signal transduction histidine kinase